MNQEIRGTLTVTRDTLVAGRATVKGNARINGNLRVDGWLDADHIKTPCKGLYQSEEALERACPHPREGWWALVGEGLPAEIYTAHDHQWHDTGQMGGDPMVDLNHYDELIEQISDGLSSANSSLGELTDTVGSINDKVDSISTVHPVETRITHSAELIIADENEQPLLTVSGGHIRTAQFDSSQLTVTAGGGSSATVTARDENTVVVVGMLGQSNMAGRGEVTAEHPIDAPALISGAGWEWRPVTAPNALSPITKALGVGENDQYINDGASKTGGCAPAFANTFYAMTGVPVVLVSASVGGTSINSWRSGADHLQGAIARISNCCSWLRAKGYTIAHRYVLWCQGETDGDNSTTAEAYISAYDSMAEALKTRAQVEKILMVRIGQHNSSGTPNPYQTIIDAQDRLCRERTDTVMVSTILSQLRGRGMMKDAYHYYQDGYNLMGLTAGRGAALHMLTGCSPIE